MDNSFEKNYNFGSQILPEKLDDVAAGLKNFIAYRLPLYKVDYSLHLQDPLAQFLSGKREFLTKSLEEIVALIREREQIRDINIYQIDKDICKTRTQMFNLPWRRYEINFDLGKIHQTLQKQVVALNREKRLEEIACWRDVTRLKSDLRESLEELAQEKRKQSLLSGKAE